MTYQATRVSLLLVERFFNSLRGGIFTLAMGFGLYAAVTNFGEFRGFASHLAARLSQMEISATSVKFGLSPDGVAAAAQDSADIPEDMKGPLLSNDLRALKRSWAIRLLYVEDPTPKCDYANPTGQMKSDLASDRHLAAEGLIALDEDSDLKAAAMAKMKAAKAEGRPWTIGEPRSCYKARLTWRGQNVKTALAEFLGAAFVAASAAPEARADRTHMKVAAATAK